MRNPPVDSRRVRRNFSNHACDYDRHARVQKRVAEALAAELAARPFPDAPALDIGTGTGEAARQLKLCRPDLSVVVSDIAHAMTACAADRLPNVLAVDCDACSLPFHSSSFGLVFSSSVFQWVNDLSLVFSDVARVLLPTGTFAFALYGERTLWQLRQSHRQALRQYGRSQSGHFHRFPSEDEVGAALAGSGLKVERLFSVDETERHASVAALLRSLKNIGAQNAVGTGPRGLASRRVMQTMMELYTRNYGQKGSIPATYHVVYALARPSDAGR